MIVSQFYLNCLAHASYLIGDEGSRTAAVVDPQRDIGQYLDEADRRGLRIRHVFLTHFHADFIAGHLELRDKVGATIYLGGAGQRRVPLYAAGDGDVVEFGRVRLQALETPGHTAESISILVFDLARDPAHPYAVLTGDTLFVGDVGRPDLRASLGWSAADLGRLLFDALHTKLLALPDATLVYPAHGAGSLCGKHLSAETVSTIGAERRTNYALQPMSRDAFVALVTADQPDAPPYFTYDAVLNSKERATLDTILARELTPLPLPRVLDLQRSGAQLLDVRDPADFAKGHLAGSLNIGLAGQFATWAGTCSTANGRSSSSPSRAARRKPPRGSGASGSITSPGISRAACRRLRIAQTCWSEPSASPSSSSRNGWRRRRRRWCSTSGPRQNGAAGTSRAA